MPITLPDETTADLVASIRRYFLDERDEEIGDLQASFVLEFVLKEIGPAVYNQGVRDAQARVQAAVAEVDAALLEPELGYTAELRARRNARPRGR